MYIHLGDDVVVSFKDLIAVVNVEHKMTADLQDIIDIAEVDKKLVPVGKNNKDKSLVIARDKVYLSPISSVTLLKRAQHLSWEEKNDN